MTDRIEKLEDLCAVVYQIVGRLLPDEWSDQDLAIMDMLSAAANGEDFGDPITLLPYNAN